MAVEAWMIFEQPAITWTMQTLVGDVSGGHDNRAMHLGMERAMILVGTWIGERDRNRAPL